MSGLKEGKYRIQLAVDPEPPIGVDSGPALVKPVITDGSGNVWTVTKLNRNYVLTLEEIGRSLFIQEDDGKLVGDSTPPSSAWSIREQDGGTYTIEVPRGIVQTRAWTVNNPEPKSLVTLNVLEIPPLRNQQWNFIPLLEE